MIVSVLAGTFPVCQAARLVRTRGRGRVMRRVVVGALALVALGVAACTSINPTTAASANGGPSSVSVAIGDSGAAGFRHDEPDLRSQWTQAFYRSTFGTHDVLYDLTSGGQTVAAVLGSVLRRRWRSTLSWPPYGSVAPTSSPARRRRSTGRSCNSSCRRSSTPALPCSWRTATTALLPALSSCQPDPSVCAQGGPASLASSVSAYDGVIGSGGVRKRRRPRGRALGAGAGRAGRRGREPSVPGWDGVVRARERAWWPTRSTPSSLGGSGRRSDED